MNRAVGSGGARIGPSVDATVEKCPRCFAELVQAWQFCPSCGLPLDPALSADGQVTSTSISYVRRTAEPTKHKRPSLTESLVQSGLHLLVLVAFIGIGVGGIIVLSPGVLRSLVSPIQPPSEPAATVPLSPKPDPGYASVLDLEFVRIEARPFRFGDPDLEVADGSNEFPPRPEGETEIVFRDYDMARFEITNWHFLQHLKWLRDNDTKQKTWIRDRQRHFAKDWRERDSFDYPVPPRSQYSLPVRGVTFDEAQAFALWLGDELGATIRLPYWYEWEFAARGDDKRRYPWGDEWDPGRCNTRERGLLGPVAGHVFGYHLPDDAESNDRDVSPFGIFNMAGNVSEWVDTHRGQTKYVMGGAYDEDYYYAQTWVKNPYFPSYRARYLGFRVVREVQNE